MKAIALLLLTGFSLYFPQEEPSITVTISNFKNGSGHAVLSIFQNEEGFPMKMLKAYQSLESPITNDVATFTLTDLPPGEYALAIIHDENGNGKLDTNFLGIPTEGACASNNAKGTFGPPSFKDASFTLYEAESTMKLKMIYF